MLSSLTGINKEVLIAKITELKGSENIIVADMICYLSELDTRKLYRELGYSSLFSYCTQGLGYSESAAYRRVQAARLLKTNPQIYDSIRLGKLSLSAVAEIAKVKEESDKLVLLKESEGKSTRTVQSLTAKYRLPVNVKRETIRAKQVVCPNEQSLFNQQTNSPLLEIKEAFSISMDVDKEFMELLNEVKAMIGYRPVSEVIRKALVEFKDKRMKVIRNKKAKALSNTRFIPKSVKLSVVKRDNRQCTFVSAEGRRCTETHALQFDHIVPFAANGDNSVDNLRLLCKSHNLLHAERHFGKEKINSYQKKEKHSHA